ncbi:MAG: nucleotidyltransferase domain-containing protein [Verrucomicrobiales bacterium]|nr:nucleotidyltransferase domain-containing protein [Verrucomicrobiales bacterium]
MNVSYSGAALERFCQQHGIAKVEAFGSVLRDNFRPNSDVDLLATLRPERDREVELLEWAALTEGFQDLFGRPVDLLDRDAVERSRNPYRKASILEKTETLYDAG